MERIDERYFVTSQPGAGHCLICRPISCTRPIGRHLRRIRRLFAAAAPPSPPLPASQDCAARINRTPSTYSLQRAGCCWDPSPLHEAGAPIGFQRLLGLMIWPFPPIPTPGIVIEPPSGTTSCAPISPRLHRLPEVPGDQRSGENPVAPLHQACLALNEQTELCPYPAWASVETGI